MAAGHKLQATFSMSLKHSHLSEQSVLECQHLPRDFGVLGLILRGAEQTSKGHMTWEMLNRKPRIMHNLKNRTRKKDRMPHKQNLTPCPFSSVLQIPVTNFKFWFILNQYLSLILPGQRNFFYLGGTEKAANIRYCCYDLHFILTSLPFQITTTSLMAPDSCSFFCVPY